MSVFLRTVSGLRNFHLFTRRDVTAFCEGGSLSIPARAALAGQANAGAEDITFWEAIVTECAPRLTFHLKAVGDCHAVHAIADEIARHDIPNVCALADRDWRDFDGTLRIDRRTIYTPDYAWENTVVRAAVVAEAILALGHLPQSHRAKATSYAQSYIELVISSLRWPVYLDISSLGSGASFVEKNERGGGLIDCDSAGTLSINRTVLISRFKKFRHKYKRTNSTRMREIDGWQNTPGHILMGAAVYIVQSYLRRSGVKTHGNPAVRAALLQHFKQAFLSGGWARERSYFKRVLSQL